jgi:FtsP/CotA-like multicopper oxidase with cupredoxin domain
MACTEVKMVPALPTAGFPATWPIDGRVGGVPDPATAGPDIVQIGSEGGLLPAPAIWKSQPVSYETNVRSITVFNVLDHDLLLGGAERADVLIDFTKYAGQTLVVYNDAPAPMPGYDPRIDYYTGMGDHTSVGGAYDPLPGYGPNTRTVMQIKVNATNTSGAGGPLNTAALAAAMPAAYAASQPAPIIPEAAYNAPFGTTSVNNYATIGTGSGALNSGLFTYTVPAYVDPVDKLTKTTKSIPVINKAIQELFDPVYGRMNATLAVELPFSTATVATTIPLNYIDIPVERLDAIKDGETQIWKITHNGVDDHPVHFHLVNVQLINRVGWDGTIKAPDANEVGWKETLRMNPLEDVYVAVKATRPVTPFGVPQSSRLLDPSQVANSQLGFTQIDPTTGQAPAKPYANVVTNFDNEYVWHCHILGHEEFDFMRPFIFHPAVIVPDAPALVTVKGTTVSWIDTTPYGGQDAQGIPTAGTNAAYPEPTSSPKNEVGFKVFNSATLVATVPANVTSWTDSTGLLDLTGLTVVAYNAAGDSLAGTLNTGTSATTTVVAAGPVAPPPSTAAPALVGPAGPAGLTQILNADGSVTLSWSSVAGATGYVVSINGSAQPAVAGTTLLVPKTSLIAGGINTFTVAAQTLNGTTTAVSSSLYNGLAHAPVALTASQGNQGNGSPPGSITLTWANNPLNINNVTGLTLSWTLLGGGSAATNGSLKLAPTVTGASIINLSRDQDYTFTLLANSTIGNSAAVTVRGLSSP